MATKLLRACQLRVLTLGAVPFISFKVHAGDAEQPNRTTVKISELPIYGEPLEQHVEVVDEKVGMLEENISIVRKALWRYLDKIKYFDKRQQYAEKTQRAKDIMDTSVAHTQSTFELVKADPNVLTRVGVIALAGLSGIVVGYRGGRIKKLAYSSFLMTCAAAVCYPREAIAVSERSGRVIKEQVKAVMPADWSWTGMVKKEDAEKDGSDEKS